MFVVGMLHHSRLSVPGVDKPRHHLHRVRSEDNIGVAQARTLYRLRSLEQLSPPPDEPLPPIPLHLLPRSLNNGRDTVRTRYIQTTAVDEELQIAASNRSSLINSYYRQDNETEVLRSACRNTLLLYDDPNKMTTEFAPSREYEQTCTLDNLSRLLHFRGRLQELGCSFSPRGEIMTYGKPGMNADLYQMICLGCMYDKLWAKFFKGSKD